jgi:uncharacterized membrane protein
MWRPVRIVIGIILVVVGLAALVTPLTPGAWLALIGLEMLGFGFLIPKKLRNLWEKSSVNAWLEKRLKAIGYPQRGSQSPDPALPHD